MYPRLGGDEAHVVYRRQLRRVCIDGGARFFSARAVTAARLARSVDVSLWIVHAAEERPPDDVEPAQPRLVPRVAVSRAPRPEERP